MEPRNYERRPGTVSQGEDYEHGMTALLLWRALRLWPDADLATNDAAAGSFDDVVLRPRSTDTPISGILIQLKHKGKNFYTSKGKLAGRNKDKLGLLYFFEEFQELWAGKKSCVQNCEKDCEKPCGKICKEAVKKWQNLGIDKQSARFVLHTNASLSPLEEGLSVEPELVELLSTRISGRAHYLDAKSHPYINGEFSEEFFDRFIVFHDQSNAMYLSELLRQEVILFCGLLTDLCDQCKKFEERVKEENIKEGDNEEQNKKKIKKKHYNKKKNAKKGNVKSLGVNFDGYTELRKWIKQQSRLLKGVSLTNSVAADLARQVQKELEKSNIMTVSIPESSSQLRSCIVAQVLKTLIRNADIKEVLFTDGSNTKNAINRWHQDRCMLVVDEEAIVQDKNLINVLKEELSNEKRLLLFFLNREANDLFQGLTLPPPLYFDVSLADLVPESRDVLLDAEVSLQGTRQTLREIAPEQVWPKLKADTLSLLLRPGLISLGADLTPPPDHYVERNLRVHPYIDMEVLKDPSVRNCFVIEGMNLEELKDVVHSGDRVKDLEDCLDDRLLDIDKWPGIQYFSSKIFNDVEIRNATLPAHILRRVHKRFLLIHSQGDMTALFKYMKRKEKELTKLQSTTTFNEDQVLESALRRAVVCSDPGMGKSSFVHRSAQRVQALHPRWWIISVAVNRFYKELKEMQSKGDPSDDDVCRVLELATGVLEKPTSSLARILLHNAVWSTGECAIFVDAIDEVAPQYVTGAKAFLSFLDKFPIKMLWVTTRPVTISAVQGALDCCIFSLDKLLLQQQEALFLNICTRPEAQNSARKLLYLLHNHSFLQQNLPITGSPLITAMLANLVNRTEEKNPSNSCKLSIFELYCAVIKNSSNGYHKKNLRSDVDNPVCQRLLEQLEKQFYQLHFACALCFILPREELVKIFSEEKITKLLELVSKGKEKTGLLVEVSSGQPVFVHRTFAEFFAARWMARSINIHWNIINIVLKGSVFSVVRYFFDRFMTENTSLLLHRAIIKDSFESINDNLIRKHFRDKDKCGRLPLHLAAREGRSNLVERLLRIGSDFDQSDYLNITPLYYAVNAGYWDCVRMLVDAGAHVEKDISSHRFVEDLRKAGVNFEWKAFEADWPVADGESFVHAACAVGHEKAILWLIEECNMKNQVLSYIRSENLIKGSSYLLGLMERPQIINSLELNEQLLAAVQIGNLRLVEQYLGQGASPGACDAEGETALHHAVRSGKSVIVAALIRRGAPLDIKTGAGETPLMIYPPNIATLLKNLEKTECDNSFGLGLKLLEASGNGDAEGITKLLLLGADTGVRRYEDGSSCLHEAVRGSVNTLRPLSRSEDDCAVTGKSTSGSIPAHMGVGNNHYNSARVLIEEGVDLEAQDKFGRRSVHLAASQGHTDIVRLLIESGADMEAMGEDGKRPIHYAAFMGHADIVRLLIERGADMEAMGGDGDRPIHLATYIGHADIVKLLIDRGADVDANNMNGDRPLLLALFEGHVDVFRLLVDTVADLYAMNEDGKQLIHLAASEGSTDIVRLLIERGADKEAMANNGAQPIHFAASEGHIDTVRLLIEREADFESMDGNGDRPIYLAFSKRHMDVFRLLRERGADLGAIGEDGD